MSMSVFVGAKSGCGYVCVWYECEGKSVCGARSVYVAELWAWVA